MLFIDASQTPMSGKKTKKATPVRSIETQTPTKFDESNTPKSNARSRSSLKVTVSLGILFICGSCFTFQFHCLPVFLRIEATLK